MEFPPCTDDGQPEPARIQYRNIRESETHAVLLLQYVDYRVYQKVVEVEFPFVPVLLRRLYENCFIRAADALLVLGLVS